MSARLRNVFILSAAVLLLRIPAAAQEVFRVMEYNVENLFDCRHDSLKQDEEFLPGSLRGWNHVRYGEKLENIARVILAAEIPDLVGLCEVENEYCVKGLAAHSSLRGAGYKYAMTDSPDERGIDVALLYQSDTFRHLYTQSVRIPNEEVGRRPTRDILHVAGRMVSGDTLDVFVCHLPSRSGGEKETEPYRLFVAGYLRRSADSVMAVRQSPNVIVMGDFNDYPYNKSISEVLNASRPGNTIEKNMLYNLMDGREGGTYRYRGQWGILDQMIVNGNLLGGGRIRTGYSKACIIDFPFLLEEDDKYGGTTPYRMYNGMRYKGGYSDHLPVLLEMEIHH